MLKKGESVKDSQVNKMEILAHVLGMLTFFVGPCLIKLVSTSTSVKLHAKNALNWQINVIIFLLAGLILKVILIGWIIIPAVLVLNIAFSIIAAIKASKKDLWEYPLSFQFLK